MSLGISNDILNISGGVITPWSGAQAALALNSTGEMPPGKADEMVRFIRANKQSSCGCWHEAAGALPVDPILVFASGWILAAMSEMNVAAQDDELAFLLNSQSTDGWWSMFPVDAEQSEYASTYATGWAIVGLEAQMDHGLVSAEKRASVKDAIGRGAAWLLSVRQERSRWQSYPNSRDGKISESISALVIHALHHSIPDQTPGLEREWLANLPAASTKIEETEPVYVEIRSKGRLAGIDQFIQIKLPWIVVATVDSYSAGNSFTRSTALLWLDKVLSQGGIKNADVGFSNWWRAEFLYALGHTLQRAE
jgi:hypothetical protein